MSFTPEEIENMDKEVEEDMDDQEADVPVFDVEEVESARDIEELGELAEIADIGDTEDCDKKSHHRDSDSDGSKRRKSMCNLYSLYNLTIKMKFRNNKFSLVII